MLGFKPLSLILAFSCVYPFPNCMKYSEIFAAGKKVFINILAK